MSFCVQGFTCGFPPIFSFLIHPFSIPLIFHSGAWSQVGAGTSGNYKHVHLTWCIHSTNIITMIKFSHRFNCLNPQLICVPHTMFVTVSVSLSVLLSHSVSHILPHCLIYQTLSLFHGLSHSSTVCLLVSVPWLLSKVQPLATVMLYLHTYRMLTKLFYFLANKQSHT